RLFELVQARSGKVTVRVYEADQWLVSAAGKLVCGGGEADVVLGVITHPEPISRSQARLDPRGSVSKRDDADVDPRTLATSNGSRFPARTLAPCSTKPASV